MPDEPRATRSRWRAPETVHELPVLAVFTALTALPLLRHTLQDRDTSLAAMAMVCATAACAATVLAAGAFYIRWRLHQDADSGWLSAALVTTALPHVYWYVLVAGELGTSGEQQLAFAVSQATTALILWAAVLAPRPAVCRAPLVIGLLLSGLLLGVRAVTMALTPSDVSLLPVTATLVVVASLGIMVALLALAPPRAWIRLRLGASLALMGLSQVAMQRLSEQSWILSLAVVAGTLGAALLVTLAFTLTRLAISAEADATRLLQRQLEHVESGLRADRSRMHEIRATLAGITTASQLLHQHQDIRPSRREQIESMMDSELARLERLLDRPAITPPTPVDLDATVEPLVLRHRTRGHAVEWEPSGVTVLGVADDIAEAVNVLLENAYRHGDGRGTRLQVDAVHDTVEIIVTDSGPGIHEAIRDHLFDWGRRGPSSQGDGIGLSAAQRLVTNMGGYLQVVDSAKPGATFALGLPRVPAPAHAHGGAVGA